jgi:hypothetical protein
MRKLDTTGLICLVMAAGFIFAGCSGTTRTSTASITDLQRDLEAKERKISSLESSLQDMETQLQRTNRELQEAEENTSRSGDETSGSRMAPGSALPEAQVGECYAKVWVPPVYRTDSETVLKREASERIEVNPARFDLVEERVLVKEESKKLEVVPATYEYVEERVLVKPASKDVVEVPAVYEYVTERVLDTSAHTVWKKGRGPVEKIDNATGEIMCLVEVPATYKTVEKRVLKTPATTKEVEIPAEYKTVKKRIVKTPPTTREIVIPAEYKTVKVRKLVQPESVQRIPVEAEYQTLTKRVLVSGGQMDWRPVLCETNMSSGVIQELQRALDNAGFHPGPIDGIYGPRTRSAVRAYQESKGLATGGLTLNTLNSLGVRISPIRG